VSSTPAAKVAKAILQPDEGDQDRGYVPVTVTLPAADELRRDLGQFSLRR
jgi:hypothetical protein